MCDNNPLSGTSGRPQTPEEGDCCGNACNPCIFDVHKKLLEQWERNKRISTAKRKNLLSPIQYKAFRVIEVDQINDDYVIINLKYTEQCDSEGCISLNPGQHVIINISSGSKAFTPISWTDYTLTLLIRVYPTGIFTNKLKNLKQGEEIKLRGPYEDFQYTRNSFMKIVMFGIGSGIAALYPIAKSIVDDELEDTRVHLIVGFRSIDQVPLKKELQLLTDFWNAVCTLYISQQDKINDINGINVQSGRLNENVIKTILKGESPEITLVLICGTREFNESLEMWINKFNFKHYHVFQ